MRKGERKKKLMMVQQQKGEKSVDEGGDSKSGMNGLNDQSAREKKTEQERQRAASGSDDKLIRRHEGRREAHGRSLYGCREDFEEGWFLKLKEFDQEEENQQTDG